MRPPYLPLRSCLLVEHLDVELQRAAGGDGGVGESGRREVRRRGVDQVACEVESLRERLRIGDGGGGVLVGGEARHDGDGLHGSLVPLGGLLAVRVERVRAEEGALRDRLQVLQRVGGQREGQALHAGGSPDGLACCPTQPLGVRNLLAEPDGDHHGGGHRTGLGHAGHLTRVTGRAEAGERSGQGSAVGGADRRRPWGEADAVALLQDADHDGCRTDTGGVGAAELDRRHRSSGCVGADGAPQGGSTTLVRTAGGSVPA